MKKHKKLKIFLMSLLSAVLLLTAVVCLKLYSGYKVYGDVRYGDGEANVMDIYIPDRAYERESNGCVLFIHGGSWSGGDKTDEAGRCRLLASHGYIVATMNYTLFSEEIADEYTVFGVLDEIDAALATVKSFAEERGIIIDKVATSGYSAGAHLSMLYAFSRADTAPVEIAFTANMAGPADISHGVWGEDLTLVIGELLSGEEITREELLSGDADALLESVSPTSYIGKDTPPTIIVQGGRDAVVPPANADSLVEKFTENGVCYDYIYMNNSSHALIENPIGRLRYYKTLIEYCKTYFE